MIFNEMYTLSNEVKIPKMGLGTWFIPDDKAAQAVCDAVKFGYRHFDTAQAYENEHGVGEGIRTCGIPREELFVTTKLAAEVKTYKEAISPVAHGEMLKNGAVQEIAAKYGVSIPQLCIRYILQLGLLPLPKTANPEHMCVNAEVDFVISDGDMETLKTMEQIKDYGEYSGFPVFGGKL